MRRRNSSVSHAKIVAVLIASSLLLSLPAAAGAQTKGQKLTDKLIKSAEANLQAISDAQNQVRVTLGAYNEIMSGKAGDNRSAYKRLVKERDKTDKAIENVRKRSDDVQAAAEEYFADWEASLAGIANSELQERSRSRLEETREGYAKVLSAGDQARAEFTPLVDSLGDQINYLAQELNPASIESLQDDAAELNEQATAFFGRVDALLKQASQYVQALRPN